MKRIITAILLFGFGVTNYKIAFAYNSLPVHEPSSHILFYPSHDTFIRKDKFNFNNGDASKITVTSHGSKQRIGLIKFDTADLDGDRFSDHREGGGNNTLKAYLRLNVAEIYDSQESITVKVFRLDSAFHENYVTWRNFDADAEASFVDFTIPQKKGADSFVEQQLDVSSLLRPGEDTILAFIVEDKGYVKFHSKDQDDARLSPSLVLLHGDEF
jgi:hypothetical protein